MRYTTGTTPVAIREPQLLVDRSALATPLRRGVVALYLSEHHPALLAHVAKNLHELAKGQVGDLSAPELLHTLERKVFDAEEVEAVTEIVCGFEEPISALPSNTPMGTSKTTTGRSPVTRPLALPTQCPAESSDFHLGHPEELRRFNLTSIAQREENLQAEVHPHRVRYFLVWSWVGRFLDDTEAKPEITAAVSLDRDGFDGAAYRAREHKLESALADAHPIGAFVLPTGLRQGEAAVLRPFFERRQTNPGTLSCLVIEVRLIGQVQPLDHHLSSLGAHAVPVLKAALFLQLRQMTLQLVVAWIGAIKAIVATRQGDEVIPDLGSVLNTFGQQALMPGSVQAVFEGASHLRDKASVRPKGSALTAAPRRVAMGRESPPVRRIDTQKVVLRFLAC